MQGPVKGWDIIPGAIWALMPTVSFKCPVACRFSEWPNDALEAVALKFLKDLDVEGKQRTQIMAMCKMFHENVRELSEQYLKEVGRINYVTPTSYLELITAFTTLLAAKRAEVRGNTGKVRSANAEFASLAWLGEQEG